MGTAPHKRTNLERTLTKLRRNGEWDRLMAVWPTNIRSVRKSANYALQPEESVAEEAWRLTLAGNAKVSPEDKRLLERNPPPIPETGDSPRTVIQPNTELNAQEECRKAAKGKRGSRIEAFMWAEQHKSEPWCAIDRSTVPSMAAYELLTIFKGPDGNSEYLRQWTALLQKDIKRETDKEKHADDDRSIQDVIRQVQRVHAESLGLTGNAKVFHISCQDCGAELDVCVHAIGPVHLIEEQEVQVA